MSLVSTAKRISHYDQLGNSKIGAVGNLGQRACDVMARYPAYQQWAGGLLLDSMLWMPLGTGPMETKGNPPVTNPMLNGDRCSQETTENFVWIIEGWELFADIIAAGQSVTAYVGWWTRGKYLDKLRVDVAEWWNYVLGNASLFIDDGMGVVVDALSELRSLAMKNGGSVPDANIVAAEKLLVDFMRSRTTGRTVMETLPTGPIYSSTCAGMPVVITQYDLWKIRQANTTPGALKKKLGGRVATIIIDANAKYTPQKIADSCVAHLNMTDGGLPLNLRIAIPTNLFIRSGVTFDYIASRVA